MAADLDQAIKLLTQAKHALEQGDKENAYGTLLIGLRRAHDAQRVMGRN